MERQPSMEYRSATPEEIRDELGLPEDATHGDVVAERLKRYEASLFPDVEVSAEGDQNA